MNNVWIGVDPGLNGAIAAIIRDQIGDEDVKVIALPKHGKELSIADISGWLWDIASKSSHILACIEKVSAMPGQGVTSMFRFGYNTGILHGIIGCMDIPIRMVRPQAWKKVILAGTAKDKLDSVAYCHNAYPGVSLLTNSRCRNVNHNMAEALCIARYCFQTFPTF